MHRLVKVYVIRPAFEAVDGSDALDPAAASSLDAIANAVSDALRANGDSDHQASVWEGTMIEANIPPSLRVIADRSTLVTLIRQMLDPFSFIGGDIRSRTNCRSVTFGHDGQAFLCLRHEDAEPPPNAAYAVSEESYRLAETDLFDGAWPPN